MAGLTLRDGVQRTRLRLGEKKPQYWSNAEIISHLNFGAKQLTGAAQNLETVVQNTMPENQQEVALPLLVDQIFAVKVYSGQLFDLEQGSPESVQIASRVGGIPILFYTKTASQTMSPQGTAADESSDITVVPLQPQAGGADFYTILGLWPIVSQDTEYTVMCTRVHPWMDKPLDPCGIPQQFADTWTAYACMRCLEKQRAYDEAGYYKQEYEQGKQQFIDYAMSSNQLRSPLDYGGDTWPSMARGSSSVIFLDQNPGLYNM